MVFSSEMRPMEARYSSGHVFRIRSAAPASAAAPGRPGAPECAVGEYQNVEFAVQTTRVERGGIDHLKREFVLFENPARPARGHDAAVLIVEADAYGLELERLARRRFRPPLRGHAQFFRAPLQLQPAPPPKPEPRWRPRGQILSGLVSQ